MNRRDFLKSLALAPLLTVTVKESLTVDELEVLAEEQGGKWLDLYLERVI